VTEQADNDESVREMAQDVLGTRSSALSASALRATMEVRRWFADGREKFWKENKFIDGLEDHIVREGILLNSPRWVQEMGGRRSGHHPGTKPGETRYGLMLGRSVTSEPVSR
jgi:hypothetical protein